MIETNKRDREYWAGTNDIPVSIPIVEIEDSEETADYAAEVIGDVKYFAQNDSRWAKIPYGPDKTWTTYAEAGCGAVSYTIVMNYYHLFDEETLPTDKDKVLAVGNLAYKKGYRKKNKGTSARLFYTFTDVDETRDVDDVKDAIDNGWPVILLVRYGWSDYGSKKEAGKGGHFIVCYGYTDDGYLLIKDPASTKISRSKVKIEGNWKYCAKAYICKPYMTMLK